MLLLWVVCPLRRPADLDNPARLHPRAKRYFRLAVMTFTANIPPRWIHILPTRN